MRLYLPKYGAKKTEVDGIVFDSKKEARRYQDLKMLRAAGYLTALEIQPEYRLEVNGHLVCKYRADFRYSLSDSGLALANLGAGKIWNAMAREIVEEVKGFMTRDAAIKIKLFKALFPELELRVIK